MTQTVRDYVSGYWLGLFEPAAARSALGSVKGYPNYLLGINDGFVVGEF